MKIEKQKIMKNMKWLVATILMIIFLSILYLVKTNQIQAFDSNIYNLISNIQNPTLTNIFKVITEFGGTVCLFFITLITVLVLFFLNKRKYGVAVTLNITFSTVIYVILKNIIRRPRPGEAERLIAETGFSFPSGHTMNNTVFYGFAIYLVYNNVKNKKIRNALCIILGIIPVLIGFSRIYLRVHYPSDVLAGVCLGIFYIILFSHFIKNIN